MKLRIIRNCIGFLSVIILCVNSFPVNAQNISEFNLGSNLNGSWNVWAEEDNASITVDGNTAHIEVDEAGDASIANTMVANFIADNMISCRDRSGIEMTIANPSDASVYVGFQAGDVKTQIYTMSGGSCVITYTNGTTRIALLSDYGTISLRPHSNMRIVMPLQLLTKEGKLISLETLLYGYSLIFGVTTGEAYSVDISDIRYVDRDSNIIPEDLGVKILGNSEIELPYQGEKVYQYSLTQGSETIFFVEKGLGPGLTITPDGKLTITNQASVQDITISAEDAQGYIYKKSVSIVENYGMRNNLDNFFVSPQDEVEIPDELIVQYSNQKIQIIRVILILGSLIMLIVCYVTLKTHKEKTNEEKEI